MIYIFSICSIHQCINLYKYMDIMKQYYNSIMKVNQLKM